MHHSRKGALHKKTEMHYPWEVHYPRRGLPEHQSDKEWMDVSIWPGQKCGTHGKQWMDASVWLIRQSCMEGERSVSRDKRSIGLALWVVTTFSCFSFLSSVSCCCASVYAGRHGCQRPSCLFSFLLGLWLFPFAVCQFLLYAAQLVLVFLASLPHCRNTMHVAKVEVNK